MIKVLTILFGKLVLFVGKVFKRGSSLPGSLTYKLNSNIMKYFKLPKTVIAVTGSSGKGSTTKIIANVYRKLGYTVCYNDKGSNERSAVITTLLDNCTLTGKVKTLVCVFEIDERYTKYVFPYIKPTHVVITNVTRDQPPRQRHFDFVFGEIYKALDKNTTIITNADDPYLQKVNKDKKFNVVYYGIDKLKTDYKKNKFNSLNISRCIYCNSKLNYDYYHIEHLGSYKCSKCDFKIPEKLYKITNYKDYVITINDKYNITINNDVLFNFYNVLAAFTTLAINKLDLGKVSEIISDMNRDTKIFNKYKYNDKNVYVLNNKNENATTFNQSVLYAANDKSKKTLVIGWWQISRRYNFDDLSWLYDIDFSLIDNVEKIIVAGPQRFDIAVRLKYDGFSCKKIKIYNDLYEAKEEILSSKDNIYAILNFDYIKPFNEIMEVRK